MGILERAWKYYDYHMKLWKHEEARNCVRNVIVEQYREKMLSTFRAEIDTWDLWSFASFAIRTIGCSMVNLVSNIGFGKDATHTNILFTVMLIYHCHVISFETIWVSRGAR